MKPITQKEKVWLITGVSRGFGLALAEKALAHGDIVIGTTRDGQAAESLTGNKRFHVLPLDVSHKGKIQSVVDAAVQLYGRLDVVVNNAGYGLMGSVEDASDEEIRKIFEVNFFGLLNVIKAVLPILRKQRSGHIINFSSVAGIAVGPGAGLYAASKFAVEGLSEGLAQEVSPLGIRVTVVELGAFRTDFLSDHSLRISKQAVADYQESAHASINQLKARGGKQRGDPARAAAAILQAVYSEKPPLHLVLGADSLQRIRDKLARLEDELTAWENVTVSTDFTD